MEKYHMSLKKNFQTLILNWFYTCTNLEVHKGSLVPFI